jgi:hypothetical protein
MWCIPPEQNAAFVCQMESRQGGTGGLQTPRDLPPTAGWCAWMSSPSN